MGKKILLGCGILLVVGLVAGGILGYYFVYLPARDFVAGLSEVSQVVEMNAELDNQAGYTPPSDRLLTEGQVTTFVEVQRQMVSELDQRLAELKQKYERYGSGDAQPGLSELAGMWSDIKSVLFEAKQSQIRALNQQGMSIEEYRWVREEFYRAVGAEFVSVNLEQIAEAVKTQNPDLIGETSPDQMAPEANRQLVAPYKDEVTNWIAYAWLGL